ncbi:MAG: hypothetical protein ACEQSR_16180, partial [Candidatus Methylacidiphilales bacterium]
MKKNLLLAIIFSFLQLASFKLSAQTTISTNHTQNNGASMITFNVRNNNSFPIKVTEVRSWLGTNTSNAVQVLYNQSPI